MKSSSCKLGTCNLIDEFEKTPKSMEDYKFAINHSVESTELTLLTYMKKYPLPFPQDWPTWHFIKKLIAQQSNISYISLILEQCPFHVSLNAEDDIISVYRFFF